jgi:hypothetical protein
MEAHPRLHTGNTKTMYSHKNTGTYNTGPNKAPIHIDSKPMKDAQRRQCKTQPTQPAGKRRKPTNHPHPHLSEVGGNPLGVGSHCHRQSGSSQYEPGLHAAVGCIPTRLAHSSKVLFGRRGPITTTTTTCQAHHSITTTTTANQTPLSLQQTRHAGTTTTSATSNRGKAWTGGSSRQIGGRAGTGSCVFPSHMPATAHLMFQADLGTQLRSLRLHGGGG